MQIVSQYGTIQEDDNDCHPDHIRCAILRPDGQIHYEIAAGRKRAEGEPDGVTQIAIVSTGLWCVTTQGHLYLWVSEPESSRWVRDRSISSVRSIGRLEDGRLCAVLRNSIRVQEEANSDSKAEADVGLKFLWVAAPKLNRDLADSLPQNVRRRRPRFTMRSLMWMMLLIAGVLGPFKAYRDASRRAQIVAFVEASGAVVQFSHQFDTKGDFDKDAVLPGPKWLQRWLGRELFLRPHRCEAFADAPFAEIGALSSLRELQIKEGPVFHAIDLADLSGLRHLKTLSLQQQSLANYEALGSLKQLRKLELIECRVDDGTGQWIAAQAPEVLDAIASLKLESLRLEKVEQLTLRALSKMPFASSLKVLSLYDHQHYDDSTGFKAFSALEDLSIATIGDLKGIGELTKLKRLSVYCDGRMRSNLFDLRSLTNLESLSVTGMCNYVDLKSLVNMKQLKSLKLGGMEYIAEMPIDLTPLEQPPKLQELHLNKSLGFDVSLLSPGKLSLEQVYILRYPARATGGRIALDNCNVTDLGFMRNYSKVAAVSLADNQISDITPLLAIPKLATCNLNRNPIKEISVLAKLSQLKRLLLEETLVSDLSPLSRCTELERLFLAKTLVRDIEPLQNCKKLARLDLSDTLVTDISALAGLPKLRQLSLANTQLRNAEAIRSLKGLYELDLSGVPIDGVELHEEARVDKLNLRGTLTSNLNRVPTFPRFLDLSHTPISDLTGIGQLRRLYSCNLAGTKVTDITPIATEAFWIKSLNLSDTTAKNLEQLQRVALSGLILRNVPDVTGEDLRWLKTMNGLFTLDLSGTDVDDLLELAEWSPRYLHRLDLSNTTITSLKGIGHIRVESLNLANTKIERLTHVPEFAEMESKDLNLSGCPLAELTLGEVERIRFVSELRINVGRLKRISALERLESVRRLHLEDVQPTHRFDWLAEMPSLYRLTLSGTPVSDETHPHLFAALARSPRIIKLVLPSGSTIRPKRYPVLESIAVYAGDERIATD